MSSSNKKALEDKLFSAMSDLHDAMHSKKVDSLPKLVKAVEVLKKEAGPEIAMRSTNFWKQFSPLITEARSNSKSAHVLSKYAEGGYTPATMAGLLKEKYPKQKRFADGGEAFSEEQDPTQADMEKAHAVIVGRKILRGEEPNQDDIMSVKYLAQEIRNRRELPLLKQEEIDTEPYEDLKQHILNKLPYYNDKKKTGGVFDGPQDKMAGDKIPARVNAGEMVLNAEQQQRISDKLHGAPSDMDQLKEGGRIDDQLAAGKLKIDPGAQEQLMQVARGQRDPEQVDNDQIVQHFDDGTEGAYPVMDENALNPQNIPMQNPSDSVVSIPQSSARDADPSFMENLGKVRTYGYGMDTAPRPIMPASAAPNVPREMERFLPQTGPIPAQDQNLVLAPERVQTAAGKQISVMPSSQEALAANSQDNVEAQRQEALRQESYNKALAESKAQTAAAQTNAVQQVGTLDKITKEYDDKQKAIQDKDAENIKIATEDIGKTQKQLELTMDRDPNSFWGNMSTPGKIATGAALALSFPFMLVTGKNPVLDFINNSIEHDLSSQRLGLDMYLAKKDYLYKLQQLQISKLAQNTNNFNAKKNAEAINSSIDQNRSNIQAQQLQMAVQRQQMAYTAQIMNYKLKGAQGGLIPNAEILPSEDRNRFVNVPGMNGEGVLAHDEKGATTIKTAQEAAQNISADVNRLLDLSKNGSVLPTNELKGQINTIIQSLKGNLTHPIFGTATREFESGLLNDLVNSPTDIFQIKGKTVAGLNALKDKVNTTLDSAYGTYLTNPAAMKQATGQSQNEERTQKIMNSYGLPRTQAVNALRKSGYYQE